MKVLVVDDDRVVADLVAFTVRRAGYEAVMAAPIASAFAQRSCFLFHAKAQRHEEQRSTTSRLGAFA